MYLVGIDAIAIMGFSGHRTIKSFMKYIGVKQEQNAMRLKDNPFFKKWMFLCLMIVFVRSSITFAQNDDKKTHNH